MRIIVDLHDDTMDAMENKGVGLEEDGVLGAFAVEFKQVKVGDVVGGKCVGEGKGGGGCGGRVGWVLDGDYLQGLASGSVEREGAGNAPDGLVVRRDVVDIVIF